MGGRNTAPASRRLRSGPATTSLTGCLPRSSGRSRKAWTASPSRPSATRKARGDMPTSETVNALQQAAEGLTYQSETDAPWKAFAWPTAEGEPTGAGVRQRGRHRADAPVAEQTVDEF